MPILLRPEGFKSSASLLCSYFLVLHLPLSKILFTMFARCNLFTSEAVYGFLHTILTTNFTTLSDDDYDVLRHFFLRTELHL